MAHRADYRPHQAQSGDQNAAAQQSGPGATQRTGRLHSESRTRRGCSRCVPSSRRITVGFHKCAGNCRNLSGSHQFSGCIRNDQRQSGDARCRSDQFIRCAGDGQAGKGLFVSQGCVACHTMEGQGGKVGPDLSNEAKLGRSSQWLIAQITDPTKHNPATKMPAHQNMTQPQLKGLTDYILNPSPSPAAAGAGTATNTSSSTVASANGSTDAPDASATVVKMIGDAKHGAVLFAMDCAKCHGKDGEGKVPNPGSLAGMVPAWAPISRALFTNDPVVFAATIDKLFQNGATSAGPGPALQMPAFGTTHSLTLPEITNIEACVLSLNGVDAAKIIHPGITPAHFVAGTAVLLVLALLAIGGLWVHYRSP